MLQFVTWKTFNWSFQFYNEFDKPETWRKLWNYFLILKNIVIWTICWIFTPEEARFLENRLVFLFINKAFIFLDPKRLATAASMRSYAKIVEGSSIVRGRGIIGTKDKRRGQKNLSSFNTKHIPKYQYRYFGLATN